MRSHHVRRTGRAATSCAAFALLVAFTLGMATAAGAVTANGRLQIIQLDVGQGDGAVVITPLGQVAMFDNGVSGNPTPASGVKVLAQLQALGVTHVDHHFASHYHSDHIGLTGTIFGSGGVALDYGWDRAESYTTSTYTNYVTTLGSRRRTLVKGQVITLDSLSAHPVTIRCVDLAGAGTNTTDENGKCLVMKVTYGEFDMLFGGDLISAVESVVATAIGPVEVYKVHHHGSSGSSNATFLAAIQPKIGVISCGNGNSYGHPTSAALTRLHTQGVKTYWTETGAGATPLAGWDKVSNNQVVISATWQPGGVDTVRGTGFADTFTNSGTAVDATPPVVALASPDGGEDWKAGSTHAITWTASDNVGVSSVDIALSTDGGATYPDAIATAVPNTGSYDWSVPDLPGSALRVRVTARDAIGNSTADASAASFAVSTWTIAASAGTHGSISPAGSVAVVEGASSSFTIAPDADYEVDDVLVDGVSVGPVTEYAFPGVAADHTIVASFAAPASVSVPYATDAELYRASPNPFVASVHFGYRVSGTAARVDIGVFDLSGRQVRELVSDVRSAGTYTASWDGLDAGGAQVHRGVYFIRSVIGGRARTIRVASLR